MSDTSTMSDTLLANSEQYRSLAATYRAYGQRFEPGSLGRIGNDTEADKYDQMATQQAILARAYGGSA